MSLGQAVAERQESHDGEWVQVTPLADLKAKGRQVVKVGRKQIVLFHGEKGIYACNNRCPHEGYPLKEGHLAEGCILTCNWHNWKFDLEGGETLVGGDKLRRYRVEIRGEAVWIDVADPPGEARVEAALDSLRESFRQLEYDRMGREIARLQLAGGDPLSALRAAIDWTHDRLEFGTQHSHAAAPDWLALRNRAGKTEAAQLVPLMECVGHFAWDTLREPLYPYPEGEQPYDAEAFVAAIEGESEPEALALLRGALREGLTFEDLEKPLAAAALAHYADFGHSAIYVYKTGELIKQLGRDSVEPLLLALVRSLIMAFREDLIPEFRGYAKALAAWDGKSKEKRKPKAQDFIGLGVRDCLARSLDFAGDPVALYKAQLGAAGWSLLHFDRRVEARNHKPVSQNVGWLDFTHAITFANAVRVLCSRHPELWPQGLLQIACFLGRNSAYTDAEQDLSEWQVKRRGSFLKEVDALLLDHGQFEYIVSSHLMKLSTAVREEMEAAPRDPGMPDLLAGLNRFLHTPIKRKFSLRTARQSLAFVAAEG